MIQLQQHPSYTKKETKKGSYAKGVAKIKNKI